VATKRSDQFPLWPVTEGWFGDSRCREEPSASGALPGRDTPFGVSHFAQSSIHLGARGTVMSIRLEERESSQEFIAGICRRQSLGGRRDRWEVDQ
jgi:hypothetical protein